MNKFAQGFNTAAQDSNPGSHSRESEVLPLSHSALLSPDRRQTASNVAAISVLIIDVRAASFLQQGCATAGNERKSNKSHD